jgi:hypothetical protein
VRGDSSRWATGFSSSEPERCSRLTSSPLCWHRLSRRQPTRQRSKAFTATASPALARRSRSAGSQACLMRSVAFYLRSSIPYRFRRVVGPSHRVDQRRARAFRVPPAASRANWASTAISPGTGRAARLAQEHGIGAFCYWHYWFGVINHPGTPVLGVLASGEPDFPFCLAWANEELDGHLARRANVLIEQTYPGEDDHRRLRCAPPALTDRCRVDGGRSSLFNPTRFPTSSPSGCDVCGHAGWMACIPWAERHGAAASSTVSTPGWRSRSRTLGAGLDGSRGGSSGYR